MFKPRKNTLKFLKYYIDHEDAWFTPFSWYDVLAYLDNEIMPNTDPEVLSHQTMNFATYMLRAGYIEVCNDKHEDDFLPDYRLTIKGYEHSTDSVFQRHPQISGIVIGATLSFMLALIKSGIDLILSKY